MVIVPLVTWDGEYMTYLSCVTEVCVHDELELDELELELELEGLESDDASKLL